jgi:hypothetical protein
MSMTRPPRRVIATEQATTTMRAGSATGRATAADCGVCVLAEETVPMPLPFVGRASDAVTVPKLPGNGTAVIEASVALTAPIIPGPAITVPVCATLTLEAALEAPIPPPFPISITFDSVLPKFVGKYRQKGSAHRWRQEIFRTRRRKSHR